MSDSAIGVAELAAIYSGLKAIKGEINVVSTQLDSVGQEVESTRSDLSRLEEAFLEFVESDKKAKELSLAETRQVKVRQELETKFGHYAEVRRQVTGILQAADISLVRQETIRFATEGLMLNAPRYWLAPALVALAGWLSNNKDLATKAVNEAVRRDDEKTSLFFALITRRAARANACSVWLGRYFGLQNPEKLDRQTIVLIDAVASGIFSTEVRASCAKTLDDWVQELSQRAGFVDEQRKQWTDALISKMPSTDNGGRYPHLKKYSLTWQKLSDSLNAVAIHAVALDYFQGIYDGAIPPSPTLAAAVDELLDKLVGNFDDQELPLRRNDRLYQLIIDENGDRNAAQSKFDLESKALDEHLSFTQLLTNAAMHPETSHASRATQRFAIALSKKWIKDAHGDLGAEIRRAVPTDTDISIEDWHGVTKDGDNEGDLARSLTEHLKKREADAVASIGLESQHWIALVVGIGCLLFVGKSLLFGAIGIGFLIWFYTSYSGLKKKRDKVSENYAKLGGEALQEVKACLAEVVEYRREFAKRDAAAPEFSKLLDGISPEQYVLHSHDKTRQIISR